MKRFMHDIFHILGLNFNSIADYMDSNGVKYTYSNILY